MRPRFTTSRLVNYHTIADIFQVREENFEQDRVCNLPEYYKLVIFFFHFDIHVFIQSFLIYTSDGRQSTGYCWNDHVLLVRLDYKACCGFSPAFSQITCSKGIQGHILRILQQADKIHLVKNWDSCLRANTNLPTLCLCPIEIIYPAFR